MEQAVVAMFGYMTDIERVDRTSTSVVEVEGAFSGKDSRCILFFSSIRWEVRCYGHFSIVWSCVIVFSLVVFLFSGFLHPNGSLIGIS